MEQELPNITKKNNKPNIWRQIITKLKRSKATNITKITTLTKHVDNAVDEVILDSKADVLANPYLNARRTWNEHVGSLVTTKQNWQFIALLCLLIALAAIGGVIHIGSQSKFIPYVVEVDKLGQTLSVGALNASNKADPRIIHATLARFINNARFITSDTLLQRKAIYELYAHLNPADPATTKMDEWLNSKAETNPFKRAESENVSIQIRTIIPETEHTWQVEWLETTRNTSGNLQGLPATFRAMLTIYIAKQDASISDEQLRDNPLGIYIKDFNWSKVN